MRIEIGTVFGWIVAALASLSMSLFAATRARAEDGTCPDAPLSTAIARLRERVELRSSQNERENARLTTLADCLLQQRDAGFERARASGSAEFQAWIDRMFQSDNDARLLLTAAGAYLATRGDEAWDVELFAELPQIIAMLERSSAIAPKLEGARALILLGGLACARPRLVGGQPNAGVSLLERAAQLTLRKHLEVQLRLAEDCAVALHDRDSFHALLYEVIGSESGSVYARDNEFAKQRALSLLANADALFPN